MPGDELVTSGLGGRFPPDYPVATVMSVTHDPTDGFVSAIARPKASLDSSRQVLVIRPREIVGRDE
jgi:rod shape-determining protein MreC